MDSLAQVYNQRIEVFNDDVCHTLQVSREKALASEEEKKVQVINADVSKKQRACQEDLAKAEPALIAAKNALGTPVSYTHLTLPTILRV